MILQKPSFAVDLAVGACIFRLFWGNNEKSLIFQNNR